MSEDVKPKRDSIINRAKFSQMVEAYREIPGDAQYCAKQAGVSRPTAVKAWEEGWPHRGWPPIRTILEEEKILARATRAATQAMVWEQPLPELQEKIQSGFAAEVAERMAKDDAIAVRAREGEMVNLSRENTIALMQTTSKLIQGAFEKAGELMVTIKADDCPMTGSEVVKLVTNVAYLTKTAAEAAKMTMEMERLLMGQPTEIVGLDVRNMSLEDAARTIQLSMQAYERIRARGLLPPSFQPLSTLPIDEAAIAREVEAMHSVENEPPNVVLDMAADDPTDLEDY